MAKKKKHGMRDAKFNPMSHGGLNPTKTSGKAQRMVGGMLESDVSGTAPPGGSPSAGMGGKSPSANKPAAAASRAGRIATGGQARGGPRQMSSAVGTPKGGTAAK